MGVWGGTAGSMPRQFSLPLAGSVLLLPASSPAISTTPRFHGLRGSGTAATFSIDALTSSRRGCRGPQSWFFLTKRALLQLRDQVRFSPFTPGFRRSPEAPTSASHSGGRPPEMGTTVRPLSLPMFLRSQNALGPHQDGLRGCRILRGDGDPRPEGHEDLIAYSPSKLGFVMLGSRDGTWRDPRAILQMVNPVFRRGRSPSCGDIYSAATRRIADYGGWLTRSDYATTSSHGPPRWGCRS